MATRDELRAAAEAKGLTVTRQDGRTDLAPTAADYQHALDIESGALEPDPPATTSRTFEVTGAFPVLGHAPGSTFTAEVDADGLIRDDAGRARAVEALLVEQGAIRSTEEGSDG